MKTIVTIPTYDEKDNVEALSAAVLKQSSELEILFGDDNSPDGTGAILDKLAAASSRIKVLHRPKKEGLGKAYIALFAKALELGADRIIQMDADFSHDPSDIPRLLDSAADLCIASRYVKGGKTLAWPFKRLLISRLGGLFVRLVTGMPIKDPTGGFKCWKASTLKALDFASAESTGYSFQLEMNHRAWIEGFGIEEVPITFADRKAGYSKISADIAIESFRLVLRLWRKVGFRRWPKR